MRCANCGDEILDRDTRYEKITPVEGGGQTMDRHCSIACMNADVGFTDDEIEALMRQEGYEIPPDRDHSWAVYPNSFVDVLDSTVKAEEYYLIFEHIERNFDVELRYVPLEELYEIALYSYDLEDGDKIGLEDQAVERTAPFQRALGYAESFMEMVEDRRV